MSYYARKKAVSYIEEEAKKKWLERRDLVALGLRAGLSSRSTLKLVEEMTYSGILRSENGKWRRAEA